MWWSGWKWALTITSLPFNARVVVARVKAVLRRSGAIGAESLVPGGEHGLLFNGWRLDTRRCELFNPQQQSVALTRGVWVVAGVGAKRPPGSEP